MMNYQQPMYKPTYLPPQQTPPVRPVSSLEEVKASPIDFDGSIFYFPDIVNKRIYTKNMNIDGTVNILMYEQKEIPSIPSSEYITRKEFEDTLKALKDIIVPLTENNKPQTFDIH